MVTVKTCESSYKQCCFVQALWYEAGWTLQKIADNQKLSVGTVWDICNRPTTPKKKKGQPFMLDTPTCHQLVFTATLDAKHWQKPFSEIAEICRANACERTLRKAFDIEGYSQ